MDSYKVENGTVLLAEPFMQDSNFRRSVILVCENNNEDGTVGFVLNKPLQMKINELITDFPEIESHVFYGGPVATDTIHYIHNIGEILDDSTPIIPGIQWGGDFEKLKFLIESKLVLPLNIRFFVGYSGWSTGQLKEELGYKSWVTTKMHPSYIFKSKPEHLWQQVMFNLGDTFSVIAQIPETHSLN